MIRSYQRIIAGGQPMVCGGQRMTRRWFADGGEIRRLFLVSRGSNHESASSLYRNIVSELSFVILLFAFWSFIFFVPLCLGALSGLRLFFFDARPKGPVDEPRSLSKLACRKLLRRRTQRSSTTTASKPNQLASIRVHSWLISVFSVPSVLSVANKNLSLFSVAISISFRKQC